MLVWFLSIPFQLTQLQLRPLDIGWDAYELQGALDLRIVKIETLYHQTLLAN